MSKKPRLAAFALIAPILIGWVAACLDSPPGGSDGGTEGSAADGAGGDGTVSDRETGAQTDSGGDGVLDRAVSDGPPLTDAQVEGGRLGLLVDDMTATNGTQISLAVAPGETPGSYYTYRDGPNSRVLSTAQLVDVPVSPFIVNADGSQIVGEICFEGTVLNFAGLGMSLAYGNPPDATPESGLSSPVPFDASRYGGVSFYLWVDLSDGPAPSLRFGVPDTQTADPVAWPTTVCAAGDAGGALLDGAVPSNPCDDDFGSDLSVAPGAWTRVAFRWSELAQQTWGTMFTAMKTDQLIGMKWQVNGAGVDAAAEPFRFCISDIYFTP